MNLNEMSDQELDTTVIELGLELPEGSTRDELIAAIAEATKVTRAKLKKMNKDKLVELAETYDLVTTDEMTKAEISDMIMAAAGDDEPEVEDEPPAAPVAPAPAATVTAQATPPTPKKKPALDKSKLLSAHEMIAAADKVCIMLVTDSPREEYVAVQGRAWAIPPNVPCIVPDFIVDVLNNAVEKRETLPETGDEMVPLPPKPRFAFSQFPEGSKQWNEAEQLQAKSASQVIA